jgi:putative intracellular protease/amidase
MSADFDTVFYPGGHGPMWDLAEDHNSVKLLESFLSAGKTFALVCHSSGAMRHVKTPEGKLLVEGKDRDWLHQWRGRRGRIDEGRSLLKNWGVHTVADGQLITGQNPASSGPAAKALIKALNKKAR